MSENADRLLYSVSPGLAAYDVPSGAVGLKRYATSQLSLQGGLHTCRIHQVWGEIMSSNPEPHTDYIVRCTVNSGHSFIKPPVVVC
jgi:hypothetical protein